VILAAVPSALCGGIATSFTSIFSYIPATTPHHIRPIRFMLVEAIIFIATPIASVIGGYLLNTTKYYKIEAIGKNGQLLNYTLVYIISIVLSILSFFWVIFFVDEIRDKEQLEKFDLNKVHKDLYVPKNGEPRPLPRSISEQKPKKHPCLMLFDCGINFLFAFEYVKKFKN
jgi:MFS family permease